MVKEFVENVIDVGVICIWVELEEGGMLWICVIDNGLGMLVEDVMLVLICYVISKVLFVDDLK